MNTSRMLDQPLSAVLPAVDWRWRRALVAGDPTFSRPRNDAWVARAARYLASRDRAYGEREFSDLVSMDPCIHASCAISESTSTPKKWELEARLLTGESIETIARKCAMAAEVVEAYERLFFHVIDKLDARSYISHVVFGPALLFGLNETDTPTIWKLLAYQLGPHALDAAIDLSDASGRLGRPGDGQERSLEQRRTLRGLTMLIATWCLPISECNVSVLQRLTSRLDELKQEASRRTIAAVTRPLLPPLTLPVSPTNPLGRSRRWRRPQLAR